MNLQAILNFEILSFFTFKFHVKKQVFTQIQALVRLLGEPLELLQSLCLTDSLANRVRLPCQGIKNDGPISSQKSVMPMTIIIVVIDNSILATILVNKLLRLLRYDSFIIPLSSVFLAEKDSHFFADLAVVRSSLV